MQIVSAASAFPKNYYPQQQLFDALQDYWGDELQNPAVLQRLHRNVGVDGRYLAIPKEEYPGLKRWGEANIPGSRALRQPAAPSRRRSGREGPDPPGQAPLRDPDQV